MLTEDSTDGGWTDLIAMSRHGGAVSDDRPYRDPEIIQGVDGAIAHAVGMNHQDFGGFLGASVTADASAAFCSRVRREMNMTAMVSDMRR